MQNLINALNAGITEYKDGGTVIQHPPTSTMLRAARTLSELNNINLNNQQIIIHQQKQITTQLMEIEQLQKELINGRNNLQSLRQSQQQTSNVGSISAVGTGSNSTS
jgi:hypothetical protein